MTLRSQVAVERLLPPSNVALSRDTLAVLLHKLERTDSRYSHVWAVVAALVLLWFAASVVSHYHDSRNVYLRDPPNWVWVPREPDLRWRFFHHLRRKHSLIRLFYVVPGHTSLTRLQLSLTIFNQFLLAFVVDVTWCNRLTHVLI